MKRSCLVFGLLWSALVVSTAVAQTPVDGAFSYQGRLKQDGQALTGTVDLEFSLYDAPTGGNLLGTQALPGVAVADGLFSVTLNTGGEFGSSAFNGEKRWLEISVNTTVLEPRQELTAAPYAMFSLAPWTTAGGNVSYSAGRVGIGTNDPQALLHLGGTAGVDGLMFPDGTLQTTASTSGEGFWSASGADIFSNNGGNVGIGTAAPASKLDIAATGSGAELLRLSTERPWVFRQILSGSGAGLQLYSTVGLKTFQVTAAGGTNIATFFADDANPRFGVGRDPAEYTFDVRASAGIRLGLDGNGGGALVLNHNTNDNRVYMEAYNSTNNGSATELLLTGYQGQSMPLLTLKANTTSIAGKTNVVTASGTLGLEHTDGFRRLSTYVDTGGGWLGTVSNDPLRFFVNDGGASLGINTDGTVDIGGHLSLAQLSVVAGTVQTAIKGQGQGYGVYGTGGLYGVFSNGNLSASGTKSFRIDHPSDPANKYLLHYCAEAPEPLNVYSGTTTTNAKGEAWVQLPAYFGLINKDFRYTLTVVEDSDSDAFVQAKVAREIRNNRFKIRTSAPTTKVCWEVKGTRNDAWARTHTMPVEVQKNNAERGTYQHPELYGQPAERGIDFLPEPARQQAHRGEGGSR